MKSKKVPAEKLDDMFDRGEEDMLSFADLESAIKRVNVDFPLWVVRKLDEESKRIGSSRQAVIRQLVINFFDQREMFEIKKKKLLKNVEKTSVY